VADFALAFRKTLGHEGGYANDKDDPGGETWKGISRVFNPSWVGWAIIDNLRHADGFPRSLDAHCELQALTEQFYRASLWDRFQGDKILVQALADEIFDTATNLGLTRAVEFLQLTLNVLNRNQQLYPDMPVDGQLGPRTVAALQACLAHRSPDLLLKIMNALQAHYYVTRMHESPVKEKYAIGWFNRT
jgi:lysozyme family protein